MDEIGALARRHGSPRLDGFSDGVFAIVITLLVLELKVPVVPHAAAQRELPAALAGAGPRIGNYVVAFAIIGAYWFVHHYLFLLIERRDRVMLALNLAFLLGVTFLPYPVAVIGEYGMEQAAVLMYAGTLLYTGGSLLAIWAYAATGRRLIGPAVSAAGIRAVYLLIGLQTAVMLVDIGLSFLDPWLSLWVFVGGAGLLPALAWRQRRHLRARASS